MPNSTFGPLPDIILDNIPEVSWGFDVTEAMITTMNVVMVLILIMHKHRLVILRRAFVMCGTVYLYRSFCVAITSLPNSTKRLNSVCQPLQILKPIEIVNHAIKLVRGLGMRQNQAQTCGDYIFSGHTTSLTFFNLFICQYLPKRFWPCHVLSCFVNLFGVCCIFLSHEHYTIDIIIAFYLALHIFFYYHWIADNRLYFSEAIWKQIRLICPMLWLMESYNDGKVINEYQLPFS